MKIDKPDFDIGQFDYYMVTFTYFFFVIITIPILVDKYKTFEFIFV